MLKTNIMTVFPTLIGRFHAPEPEAVNRELAESLLALRSREPSQQLANAGGWHSRAVLMDAPWPAMAKLKSWIIESLNSMVSATAELAEVKNRGAANFRGQFALTAWGNIIQQGHYHRHHNHPKSAWSGVYYVAAGHQEQGSLAGVLELFDPRPFTEMIDVPGSPYGQRVLIRPENGLLVLFPGWMYHFVHPYVGQGERISIAFNASWHPST